MEERSRSIVDIKRSASPADIVVASVLITDGSVRTFSLMQSDYVQLNFSLDAAVYFEIGDYIDDEIFGRFVVTSHQMPNYNTTTGGYDYTLKLDAEYYLWKNKMFMLTTYDANENRIRKENDWCLTDKLSVHLDEVINNLTILGYNYTYQIESTAEHAQEVKFLQYTNKDILSSLTAMANEWECEWWVKDHVIHFGKCEQAGSAMDFELGVNVESMTIQKNVNKYLNKIFAYGSTQNIPSNYRKKLIFTADTNDNGHWSDSHRPLTQEMADGRDIAYTALRLTGGFVVTQIDNVTTLRASTNGWNVQSDTANITGVVRFDILNNLTAYVDYEITISASIASGGSVVVYSESGEMHTPQLDREINLNGYVTTNSYSGLAITVTFTNNGSGTLSIMRKDLSLESVGVMRHNPSIPLALTPIGSSQSYDVTFNVGDNQYGSFTFDDGVPSGFALGSQYMLELLNYAEIPASYYTLKYDDPSALAKLGENRLELPESTGGYLITDPNLTRDQIVESVVTFNNIYPHAIQKVTHVGSEEKESKEEQQDGSTTIWAWTQYILTATLADGNLFPFSKRYITDGMTLQVKFITKEDLEAAGYTATEGAEYRLAGMTFDVSFDDLAQTYTLVRNEDYGAKLPNDTLKPTVGDPFVLINWNVKVMEQLGLIDIAEQALETIAQDYLDAIEQGQFTFTCMLMSDVFFDLADRAAYYNRGIPFHTSNNEQLYVRMPSGDYILPIEGQPVRVIHGALSEPKISRVIGYQFKLDKPYDTPQYTIGETQAYSRLAQIEKEINKLQ